MLNKGSSLIIVAFVLAFVLATAIAWYSGFKNPKPNLVINSFEECVLAGFPVMESYPRQCRDSQGNLFVEKIDNDIATSTQGLGSGVIGKVELSPICPVEKNPPDPNCAPKPYQAKINVIALNSPSSQFAAQTESDSKGVFRVSLAPGQYIFQAQGGKVFPACVAVVAEIKPNEYQPITISCDTGIR